MSTMEKKAINYVVEYDIPVDNGFEYFVTHREEGFGNHYKAMLRADELWEETEATNVVVKHYGWDFYVPNGEEYAIHMLDSMERDETIIEGPLSFVDGMQKLMQLQWYDSLPWTSYKLVYHKPYDPTPASPPAPDEYLDLDELPF